MGEIFKRVVPNTPLAWTGERLTTATAGQVEIEHLHRYFLARALCRGRDVLDVASGEGYGTALLAQTARSVIGVEVSAEAVAHAAEAYRQPNLRFLEGDARRLPLGDASVDTVVSFETIEHLYEQDQFLAEVRRVLRPGGRFIISSPERDIYSPSGSSANPYHVRELTRAEFSALLRDSFAHVRLLGQRPMLGSVLVSEGAGADQLLTFEKRGSCHFEATDGLPRPVYLVAVASDQPVADVPDSLYIETAEIGAVMAAANGAEALETHTRSLTAERERLLDEVNRQRDYSTHVLSELEATQRHFAELETYTSSLAADRERLLDAEARQLPDRTKLTHERDELKTELTERMAELRQKHLELRHCKADLAVKEAFINNLRTGIAVRRDQDPATRLSTLDATSVERLQEELAALQAYVNSAGFRLMERGISALRRVPLVFSATRRVARFLAGGRHANSDTSLDRTKKP